MSNRGVLGVNCPHVSKSDSLVHRGRRLFRGSLQVWVTRTEAARQPMFGPLQRRRGNGPCPAVARVPKEATEASMTRLKDYGEANRAVQKPVAAAAK